jgi:hypothetical protein
MRKLSFFHFIVLILNLILKANADPDPAEPRNRILDSEINCH